MKRVRLVVVVVVFVFLGVEPVLTVPVRHMDWDKTSGAKRVIEEIIAQRPEIKMLISHCVTGHLENGSCDLAKTLKSIALSLREPIVSQMHTKAMGVGSRPSAPRFFFNPVISEITVRDIWTTMYITLFFLGFALMMSNLSEDTVLLPKIRDFFRGAVRAPPSIGLQVERWRAIKAVFPSFDRWYEVFSHPAGDFVSRGGVKRVCRDWLPFMYSDYSEKADPESFGEWADTRNIFRPNLNNPATEAMQTAAEAVESRWKRSKYDPQPSGQQVQAAPMGSGEMPVEDSEKDHSTKDRNSRNQAFVKWMAAQKLAVSQSKSPRTIEDDLMAVQTLQNEFEDYKEARVARQSLSKKGYGIGEDDEALSLCPAATGELAEMDASELGRLLEKLKTASTKDAQKKGTPPNSPDCEISDSPESVRNCINTFCFGPSQDQAFESQFKLNRHQLEHILHDFIHEGKPTNTYYMGEGITPQDATQWARWWSYKLGLKLIGEQVAKYWQSAGPRNRLRYVFGETESITEQLELPKEDLRMCWSIMDTALTTVGRETIGKSPTDQIREISKIVLNAFVSGLAFTMTVMTYSRMASRDQDLVNDWSAACGPLHTSESLHIVCSNGWLVGSTCTIACTNGKVPVRTDGLNPVTVTYCVGNGIWTPAPFSELSCDSSTADFFRTSSFGA